MSKAEATDLKRAAAVPEPLRASPFLRWAGGKTQLLPELRKHVPMPASRAAYHEPFVGAGALFFALRPSKCFLNDANAALMAAYACVRDNVITVTRCLAEMPDSQEQFTFVRDAFNNRSRSMAHLAAAWFIYLNKTCFNGLWRVNRKNEFNVPYDASRKGRRSICDLKALRAASAALRLGPHGAAAELSSYDFGMTLHLIGKGDVVYCDPPYVPRGGYADFTSYTKDAFGPEEQKRLVAYARKAREKGATVVLSNADVPFVRTLYPTRHFTLHEVQARRNINSKTTARGKIGELIIVAR